MSGFCLMRILRRCNVGGRKRIALLVAWGCLWSTTAAMAASLGGFAATSPVVRPVSSDGRLLAAPRPRTVFEQALVSSGIPFASRNVPSAFNQALRQEDNLWQPPSAPIQLPLDVAEPGPLSSGGEPGESVPRLAAQGAVQLALLKQPADESGADVDPAEMGDDRQNAEADKPEEIDPGKSTDDATGDDAVGQKPQTLGRRPVNNTLQFLRRQSVLLKAGSCQFDTGLAYTLFDVAEPAEALNNSGNVVGVAREDLRRRLLYSPFAVRYGLTDDVQLFGFLPVGYTDTQTSVIGSSASSTNFGQGDLTAGANMRLKRGCGYCPDVIGTLGFTAPTGQFSAPLFGVVPGSGLGQGFWAINGNLLFINVYDPIVVFYGVGYRHLFERRFDQMFYQPGEQISYQFGVGFAVNDRITLSTAFQGFYITNAYINRVDTQGTNIEPMSVRFAATILRNRRIIEPFALVGMTEFAPRASVGVVLTLF